MRLEPESPVAEGADPHGWRTCHCHELFCRLLSLSLSLDLCVPLSTGHFDNLFSKPEKNWTLSPPRQLCQVLYSDQGRLAFAIVKRIMKSRIYVIYYFQGRDLVSSSSFPCTQVGSSRAGGCSPNIRLLVQGVEIVAFSITFVYHVGKAL